MNPIPFTNRYLALGEAFYKKTLPTPVAAPALIAFNAALANEMGLSTDELGTQDGVNIFAGNVVPGGAEPLAMAYAGHQFGNFVPQLGDGRAILLGDMTAADGVCLDVQLKGSGRTFYSRNGDGRAALGPVLREYLVSEAMARLGVPTTRALAAVTTGEQVAREQLLPGGIITRVATSFIRVGSFEYFSASNDVESIRELANYVIERNYPQLRASEQPYVALLQAVVDGQAALIASWMQLGFIHGVMNTDNMSIAAETIDYGPCAFMDAYDHERVYSAIDRNGRYAYSNQPAIGLWNLTRLAETLLPLLAESSDAAVELAQTVLKTYADTYHQAWLTGMRAKCGLSNAAAASKPDSDKALIESLFNVMAANNADFTLVFFHLSQLNLQASEKDDDIRRLFVDPAQFDDWLVKWRERASEEMLTDKQRQASMQSVNPVYIPRNHQIEAAIRAAEDQGDFSVFHALHEVLQHPFTRQQGKDRYMQPPEPDEVVRQTFCGT
ncbi:MAG: YdiU family protein [Gammaproteobacteria bacterium]|nr:YdiU family protein [Gammaproteobacteria bacterium]